MENDKIKTSRASQTRDKIEVKKVWTPPNSLDAPPAPTGYRHQWIRSEILGTSDAKNVASSFMLMPARHPFFAFAPQNTLILRENQNNYIRFESLNPPFQYSKTHDSITPLFHHSNCGAKRS